MGLVSKSLLNNAPNYLVGCVIQKIYQGTHLFTPAKLKKFWHHKKGPKFFHSLTTNTQTQKDYRIFRHNNIFTPSVFQLFFRLNTITQDYDDENNNSEDNTIPETKNEEKVIEEPETQLVQKQSQAQKILKGIHKKDVI